MAKFDEAVRGFRPEVIAHSGATPSHRSEQPLESQLRAVAPVGGSGELRFTDYQGQWFPFVRTGGGREDRTRVLRVSLYNRSFTVFGFSPQVVLVNEARTSNAQLYDYRRNRAELRFQRLF